MKLKALILGAAALCAVAPAGAITITPMPRGQDGGPRFADPDEKVFGAMPGALTTHAESWREDVSSAAFFKTTAKDSRVARSALTSSALPARPEVKCLDCEAMPMRKTER